MGERISRCWEHFRQSRIIVGGIRMSKGKDISTMFTKEENKKNGRLGYGQATREKQDVISPAQYGAFLQKRGNRK